MSRSFFHLHGEIRVEFFDSQGSSGLEMEWKEVIRDSQHPSVLKTSEGVFRCWVEGQPTADDMKSLAHALGEMYGRLVPGERSALVRPCPGVGMYVSDAAISTGEPRTTVCPACEEYTGVEGNLVAFHVL